MRCPRCGKENPPGTRFCAYCGALTDTTPVSAAQRKWTPWWAVAAVALLILAAGGMVGFLAGGSREGGGFIGRFGPRPANKGDLGVVTPNLPESLPPSPEEIRPPGARAPEKPQGTRLLPGNTPSDRRLMAGPPANQPAGQPVRPGMPGAPAGGPPVIAGQPGNLTGGPRLPAGQPGNLTGGPRLPAGQPGNLTGGPRLPAGQPGNFTGGPRLPAGQPGNLTGGPRLPAGQPGNLTGGPRLPAGQPGNTPSGPPLPAAPPANAPTPQGVTPQQPLVRPPARDTRMDNLIAEYLRRLKIIQIEDNQIDQQIMALGGNMLGAAYGLDELVPDEERFTPQYQGIMRGFNSIAQAKAGLRDKFQRTCGPIARICPPVQLLHATVDQYFLGWIQAGARLEGAMRSLNLGLVAQAEGQLREAKSKGAAADGMVEVLKNSLPPEVRARYGLYP